MRVDGERARLDILPGMPCGIAYLSLLARSDTSTFLDIILNCKLATDLVSRPLSCCVFPFWIVLLVKIIALQDCSVSAGCLEIVLIHDTNTGTIIPVDSNDCCINKYLFRSNSFWCYLLPTRMLTFCIPNNVVGVSHLPGKVYLLRPYTA